jgi:DivIVA domain-containing protein
VSEAITGNEIRAKEFKVHLRGYDRAEVTEALETFAQRVDRGERIQSAEVASQTFSWSWRGFDRAQVDAFLLRLAA